MGDVLAELDGLLSWKTVVGVFALEVQGSDQDG
jgi:hypothetical protein